MKMHKVKESRIINTVHETDERMQRMLKSAQMWRRCGDRKKAHECLNLAKEYRAHKEKLRGYLRNGGFACGDIEYVFV